MIQIVVVATIFVDIEPSKQFTTAPFRPLLTEGIITLDISGETSGPESLEKGIMELVTVRGGGMPLGPTESDVIMNSCV